MPALATPLCLIAVALPFLFAVTDSPVSNFWPMLASWVCGGFLLFMAALAASRRRADRSTPIAWACVLAGGLALAAVIAGGIGFAQYMAGDVGLSPWIHASQPGLAAGNLRQRNQQATLLSLGAWALLWWVLHFGSRRRHAPATEVSPAASLSSQANASGAFWLAMGALAWIALTGAMTASRTGAVQWLVILGLVAMWQRLGPGRALRAACIGFLLFLAAAWILPDALWRLHGVRADALFERFTDESQPCTSRRVLWSNMLTLIASKPWLGWGWGELDYAHYVTLFPGMRFCTLLDNAHNLPLHLAVELGLPVAIFLCAGAMLWCLLSRPWQETAPGRQLAWGVLAIVGLHSMLEYPLWYGPFQIVCLMSLALLLHTGGGSRERPAKALALGAAALLVWGGCGYAAWDYHRVSQLYKLAEDRSAAYRDDPHSKVTSSTLFSSQLDFARLTTTPLNRGNAQYMNGLANELLHYSPEPRVIEALIESAVMLGKDDEAAFHIRRFGIAYPAEYSRWTALGSAKASTPR